MPPSKFKKGTSNKKAAKTSAPATKKFNKKPATNNKKDDHKKDSKRKALKEFVSVPEKDNYDFSDEDVEFFNENKGFGSFLTGLDAKELTRNNSKKKNKAKSVAVKQQQKANTIVSSEEDVDSDQELDEFEELDSDLEKELEDMDETEMSQVLDLEKEQKKTEKPSKYNSDEEMDYESKPRTGTSSWSKEKESTKLPIKLPGGRITQVDDEDDEDNQSVVSEVEEVEEVQKVEEEKPTKEEEELEEVKLTKKQYLISKKEELAQCASLLSEDPEENVGQLRKIRSVYRDDNPIVKKLSLLTQLAVYKDILPGYRIRPLTEEEQSQKVSKDVKKLREYEKALLQNYEQYVKDLAALLSKRNVEENESLAAVAAKCLCDLLVAKTYFNFRLEIMVSVITHMSTVKWNDGSELCKKAIIEIFENDESGKYSLDAVKMITRMIKSKGYVVSENVVSTFLHLRLKDEMAPQGNNDDETVGKKRKNNSKPFINKKAKKALKETREIEKEFKEAEAIVSKEEKDKNHSETLKLVFAFYFRILKKQTTSPLLPAVLEGLSKFAHLINMDFFDDLLNALRDVMRSFEDDNDFSRTSSGTRKRLLCITTAFELLSGQGEAISYDLKDFYAEIYHILFKSTYHTKIEEKPESQESTESEMIIRGLELMFLKKRQIPVDRLAAFVKRFSIVALNMPTKTVVECLGLTQKLVQKDNRLDALLQSEDRASNGVFMPLLNDPELCNPFGTSLYELFLYQNHYDPTIRNMAKGILKTTQ
ncbi:nucleolar complex-associated protein-domain-containing protein [Sporodiniella umbellata]|nr:nucleolar complex-associated protein-domain-containing protein [Sporodiniella umbellata]